MTLQFNKSRVNACIGNNSVVITPVSHVVQCVVLSVVLLFYGQSNRHDFLSRATVG